MKKCTLFSILVIFGVMLMGCGGGGGGGDDVADVEITSSMMRSAIHGQEYNENIEITGGQGNYAVTLMGGELPAGLNLGADGSVSGVPTGRLDEYIFRVRATDRDLAENYDEQEITITVKLTGPDKYEPDDDFETENTITYDGVEQTRTIGKDGKDRDYIKLNLTGEGNQTLKIQTYFASIPTDTLLRIYNANGELLVTDDNSGSDLFSRIVYDFTEGVFYIMVSTADSEAGDYIISVKPAISIRTETIPFCIQNEAYTAQIVATGGVADTEYSFSLMLGNLPDNLSLFTDGTISGTPTGAVGSYRFTVHVKDKKDVDNYTSKEISLDVQLTGADKHEEESDDDFKTENTITYEDMVNDGMEQSHTIDKDGKDRDYIKLNLTGEGNQTLKIQTYFASIPTDTLLRIYDANGEPLATDDNSGSGLYSRIVYEFGEGVYYIMISTANGGSGDYTISVKPAISITTESLPESIQNEAYTAQIVATGGVAATEYDFSMVSGNMPANLSLFPDGTISGRPTGAVGSYRFTVQVEDENDVDNYSSKEFSLDVELTGGDRYEPDDDFETENTITYEDMVDDGMDQSHTIDKRGDDHDYIKLNLTGEGNQTLKIQTYFAEIPTDTLLRIYNANGELLATDDNSGSGFYSRIVYEFGEGVFYIMVSTGDSEAGDYIISVKPAITITTGTLRYCIQNEAYTAQIVATGGVTDTEYDFSLGSANLPPNLSLYPDGTISGRPIAAVGSYRFIVDVEDKNDVDNYTSKEISLDVQLTGADKHEEESDDDFGTKNTMGYDSVEQSHTIDHGEDHDYIKLDLTNISIDTKMLIKTSFVSFDTNTLLRIYNANRELLATDDNSGRYLYSKIEHTFSQGSYYIVISSADGEPGDYIISVELNYGDIKIIQPSDELIINGLMKGFAGTSYIDKIEVEGGTGCYVYSLIGSLPEGLNVDTSTGEVSGTLDVTTHDVYSFNIIVKDLYYPDHYSTEKNIKLPVYQREGGIDDGYRWIVWESDLGSRGMEFYWDGNLVCKNENPSIIDVASWHINRVDRVDAYMRGELVDESDECVDDGQWSQVCTTSNYFEVWRCIYPK